MTRRFAAPAEHRTSVTLPGSTLAEMRAEAKRLQRPISWLIRVAWLLSRETLARHPGALSGPLPEIAPQAEARAG